MLSNGSWYFGWFVFGVLMVLGFIAGGGECMSEFKGKRGPWTAVDKRPYSDGFSVFSKDQYIAFVGDSDGATDYKENANLIAAAPELLSALDLILSYHDDGNCVLHREDVSRARAAIKKALGQ